MYVLKYIILRQRMASVTHVVTGLYVCMCPLCDFVSYIYIDALGLCTTN